MTMNGIGTLQESSLHAALKNWYIRPEDVLETRVDGYWIDIVRGEELIEIQTRNFSAIRRKLERLVQEHPIRLVYPIAVEKFILRVANISEKRISRRKSPKRGNAIDLFHELVRIPHLVKDPNFTLEIVYIQEEVVWQDDGLGSWRRKGWSLIDHRLITVVSRQEFHSAQDYASLLPASLPVPFTVRELAEKLGHSVPLARRMAYSLRKMGMLEFVGKRKGAYLYRIIH